MPEIPLGGSFYKLDSLPVSAQECVNLYSHIPTAPAPSKKQLFIPAGIQLATTAGSDVFNRGAHVFNAKPYFVQGSQLYRVDVTYNGFGVASYSSVLVSGATMLPGSEQVIMSDNGEEGGQMMIVLPALNTKFNAYIYTISGGLVAVADADFDGPVSDVNYIDGYFQFTKKNGQKFFISDLRDGSAYISTDFEAAEADPDYNVRSYVLRNQLYVFGQQTMQGFQNVGGAGFPFVYIQGSVQGRGLASIYAIIEDDDKLIFLGDGANESPAIYITNGASMEKISTVPIEQQISSYPENVIASCYAWNYSQAGAAFVAFTFPGQACFVFDFSTGEWHTRESIGVMGESIPCRISSVVEAYGVFLVGDIATNKIGVLSRTVYTEYGEEIPRRFVTPQFDNEGMPFFIDSIEVVSNTGNGLTTGQGSNPLVSMSISRNGGRTFGNPLERSAGMIGEYNQRIIWNQCGRVAREACMKFELAGAIPWAITKIEANFQ